MPPRRAAAAVDCSARAVRPRRFAEFRAGLLRHIAMEEKVLLPDARLRRGEPLPIAKQLLEDLALLASLMVPTPTHELVAPPARRVRRREVRMFCCHRRLLGEGLQTRSLPGRAPARRPGLVQRAFRREGFRISDGCEGIWRFYSRSSAMREPSRLAGAAAESSRRPWTSISQAGPKDPTPFIWTKTMPRSPAAIAERLRVSHQRCDWYECPESVNRFRSLTLCTEAGHVRNKKKCGE
jgi:hypothetical protein